MPAERYKILFLCTGNSARSILAEFLTHMLAENRFEAFSAGAEPSGRVNPLAVKVLQDCYEIDASTARSKSWEEFKDVAFDFIFTLCERARESCPPWPGSPITAHWSYDDPAKFEGTDEEKIGRIALIAEQLYRRLRLLYSFPVETMDRLRLKDAVRNIEFDLVERTDRVL